MNQRERILAIVVGVLMVAVVGWVVQGWIASAFEKRQQEITRLEGELNAHKRRIDQGQRAARTIAQFEQRSLPSNPDVARSHYHDWLLAEMGKAGLIEPTIKTGASQEARNLYIAQEFGVTAKGTLPQMVDLLHALYSVDLLHRLKDFSAEPIKDSKLLDIKMTVQALSMQNAASASELMLRPAQRLKLADREAYHKLIVGRNLLGPPNNAPQLSIGGSTEANTNRQMELSARGTDPDPLDKVKYRLVESPARDARFDATSGRFSWTPRATGKYEFIFEAIDDGIPSKTSAPVKVVVNVTDPPPVVARAPDPPRLAFDNAKFTVLTAVLDIGGTAEIWLHVRPTGETLKLHKGDKFEIGSIKGTVAQIGETDFVFEMDGKQRKLERGEVLEQAQAFTQAATTAEPSAAETSVESPDDL
jgi:hypothetical protein